MKQKFYQCVQNANQNVTPEETINAIKTVGFDGAFIQWYNKDWEFSQQQQLNLCRELGLKINFVHLDYLEINHIWEEGEKGDEVVADYLKDLDACHKNKIKLVVMHLTYKSIVPAPNEIGIKRLQKLADYAKKLKIKIAFENTKLSGYLEYVFEHIKNNNIGVCFDSGHYHAFYKDSFNWKAFKKKIFAVHLHDNFGIDDQHLLPFDGTTDWNDLILNLKQAKYKGPITLESCYVKDYTKMSVEEFYQLSLDRAKKLI